MIPVQAVHAFAQKQKRLLRQTYDAAWQDGVDSYQPPPEQQQQAQAALTSHVARDVALAGLTGAALLVAKRSLPYESPKSPDAIARAVALAPAYTGVDAMVGELTSVHAALDDLADILDSYSVRLDNGDSVAWAGEQAGFSAAVDAAGYPLQWVTEEDDSVCESCLALGDMPAQPLEDWPCQPGDGTTDCVVGCRCTFEPADESDPPDLTDDQQTVVDGLLDRRANALNDMMPDASILE